MNDSDKSGRPSLDRGSSPSPMSANDHGEGSVEKRKSGNEISTRKLEGERGSACSRLTTPVIQNILSYLDPETFLQASLLNRKWRDAVDTRKPYLHQLNRHLNNARQRDVFEDFHDKDLRDLKRLLIQVVKHRRQRRQYKRQIWNLVAPSTASSTVSPHGEAFRLTFSSKGHLALAASSSRIFVLNVTGETPVLTRIFKVQRRPQCCTITDDGTFLAVLSSDWKVHTYHLGHGRITLGKAMILDGPTRTIAMSPDRTLLAAAHSDFIELQSMAEDSPSGVRRRLPCQGIASLTFSLSGMMLLGTTKDYRQHLTTLVSAPMQTGFDPETGIVEQQRLDQLWTSQLLFPNIFRECGHAALVPDWYEGEISRVFGYDGPAEAFGLINIDEYQFQGQTFDEAPVSIGEANKCPTLPSVDMEGKRVAIARGKEIHVHRIPAVDPEGEEEKCELLYNIYRPGSAISRLQWVGIGPQDRARQRDRLISVLRGRRQQGAGEEDDSQDKAQLMVMDFKSSDNGVDEEFTFELDNVPIEILEEDETDIDEEIAIAGRVGTARADGTLVPKGGVRRSVTSGRQHNRRRSGQARRPSTQIQPAIHEDGVLEPMEAPYSHDQPRPTPQLARAATVAAATPRFRQTNEPPRMRIPGDRSEIPDESDADNWVPPPPPYEKQAEEPLQENVARTFLPGVAAAQTGHAATGHPGPFDFGFPSNRPPNSNVSSTAEPSSPIVDDMMRRPYVPDVVPPPRSPLRVSPPTVSPPTFRAGPYVAPEQPPLADLSQPTSLENPPMRSQSPTPPSPVRDEIPIDSRPQPPIPTNRQEAIADPVWPEPKAMKRVLTKSRKKDSEAQPQPDLSRSISPRAETSSRRSSSNRFKSRNRQSLPVGYFSQNGGLEPEALSDASDAHDRKLSNSRSASSLGHSKADRKPSLELWTNGDMPPLPLPAGPTSAQLASLSRRQDGIPRQLARSRSNSAPRGAVGAHRASWNGGSNEYLPNPQFRQSSYGSQNAPSPQGSSPPASPRIGTQVGMHQNGSTGSFKQPYTQRLGTIEDDDPTHMDPSVPQPPPSPGPSHRNRMSGGYSSRRSRLSNVVTTYPSDPADVPQQDLPNEGTDSSRPSDDGVPFGQMTIIRNSPYAHDLPPEERPVNGSRTKTPPSQEQSGSRTSLRAAIHEVKKKASATRLRDSIVNSGPERRPREEAVGRRNSLINRQRSSRIFGTTKKPKERHIDPMLPEVAESKPAKKREKKCTVM